MTALITLSHGSRHRLAQRGIQELTRAAGSLLGVTAVDAHLEFNDPNLARTAAMLAAAGHEDAVVVPLLFTDAFHAQNDVPAHMEAARKHLPLRLARSVGMGADLAEVLAGRVAADAPAGSTVVLYPVGTSDRRAAAGYEVLAGRVEKLTGQRCVVVAATRGGPDAVRAIAGPTHLLPLFFTEGLLLDRARESLGDITYSAPLGVAAAPIVAARFLAA